jgi:BirA family biotin operon repressor/biotin-[acetyl-CoA-carboxylase] ligase
VIAEAQSAGRGRLGRTWHSPPGTNLYTSIVLRPRLEPAQVPQLALVAGLAVADALAAATGVDARLKWPNDVLVDGRKVAGILTEMEAEVEAVRHVIVGIGVNLNGDRFPDDLADKATSLRLVTGAPVSRAAVTAALLAALEARYHAFVAAGFPPLRAAWTARSWLDGKEVRVAAAEGEIRGRVAGVADDGALELLAPDGTRRRIVAGDVSLAATYEA